MNTIIYNTQGKKTGTFEAPEKVFGVAWNNALVHQVVTSMQANARTPVAHTKFRGEVRGGGRKPWQQKGTGRARHGSTRSPIWKGGGVSHGPRNDKQYARAIPKKMRAKALAVALSRKLKDGEILFVDSFAMSAPKTALVKKALVAFSGIPGFEKLARKNKNAALIALSQASESTAKSFQNLKNVVCTEIRNINPASILKHAYLIIENPDVSVPILEKRVMGTTTK
ncbi:MAG TPA: 50S ribosomal protein L4 [Candidatus Paceibacterota bacterium]